MGLILAVIEFLILATYIIKKYIYIFIRKCKYKIYECAYSYKNLFSNFSTGYRKKIYIVNQREKLKIRDKLIEYHSFVI